MNVRNKITISFLPHDDDLWNFIQSKKEISNLSEYIRNLIRNDMNNKSPTDINEEMIVEKFLLALQKNDILIPEKKKDSIEDILANEEVKNTINSLF